MTSWRDGTARDVQDDLDDTLGAALSLAEEQLGRSDGLVPFALLQDAEGFAVRMVEGAAGDGQAVVDALVEAVRGERDQHRCAAIVADSVVDGSDAVQVWLEHPDPSAPALVVAAPYTRRWGKVRIGDLRLGPGQARIWD